MSLNKGTYCVLAEEGHMGWDPEAKLLVTVGSDSREDVGSLREL